MSTGVHLWCRRCCCVGPITGRGAIRPIRTFSKAKDHVKMKSHVMFPVFTSLSASHDGHRTVVTFR